MQDYKKNNNTYQCYNKISEWFDTHRDKSLQLEKHYIDFLVKELPKNASILDLGCGTGEPIATFFMEQGYKVTGIDASEKMIAICKERYLDGHWLLQDMRQIDFSEKFDLIIAWHSYFHLTKEDQRTTLKKMCKHVNANGFLVFTSGPKEGEVWSDNGGELLHHASLSTEEYRRILEKNQMTVLQHNIEDPSAGDATVWVAKKV